MAKMVQHQPYTLKLEMTEGCNLRCSFCGIQGIREARGDYKYLPLSRAKLMADRLAESGWTTPVLRPWEKGENA
jgi:tRNA A37 methylthiotransferase MiaB